MKKLIQKEEGGSRSKLEQFRYYSEIFTCSEIVCFVFLCTNDPVLVNFISNLTVIILFRIVWYFHLVVRLYKPFYEHFVTELFIEGISITGSCFWLSFTLFSLLFLSFSRQPNTPFEDDNSKDVWLKPLNLKEEGC